VIRFLVGAWMTEYSSRRVPDELAATPDEIEAAITALTPGEWLKLKRYADWRIGALGRNTDGWTGDRLLLAAVTGTRRWNKKNVDFKGFLYGAIRSISSNRARSCKKQRPAAPEADFREENEEGELFSPLDNAQAPGPSPEQQVNATQTLDLIEDLLKDDEKALRVLVAWREDFSPAEVRELEGLSQKEYNAIKIRIYRRARAANFAATYDKRGS
jgi:hypothetical protein